MILQVDIDGILAVERESDAPVAVHTNRATARPIAAQPMESVAGEIHILRAKRSIQTVENALAAPFGAGWYAAMVTATKKSLESLVAKRPYHLAL